ncbi:hypothetical protein [Leuconostoc citreum]|uniref:hypothetical protein n=1 Tax=Leuconostoc citreum TaxID=33964 RepID=UPI0032DF4BE6
MENEPVFHVVLKIPAELYIKLVELRISEQSPLTIEAYALDLLHTGRQLLKCWRMNGIQNNALVHYQSYIKAFKKESGHGDNEKIFPLSYQTNQEWVLDLDQLDIASFLFIALNQQNEGTENDK